MPGGDWRACPGATVLLITGTFLAAAAIEGLLSPLAGRLADRRSSVTLITISLITAAVVSTMAPMLGTVWLLVPVLIVGMPAFGALFPPAMALLSKGAHHERLDQGLAFGLGNLAWASGQAAAAAGSGALAQATSDWVPYSLLVAACLATLAVVRIGSGNRRAAAARVSTGPEGKHHGPFGREIIVLPGRSGRSPFASEPAAEVSPEKVAAGPGH
jgi:MFS family permease